MDKLREEKIRNQNFGKFAEEKAAEYYIENGYAIREKNWRFRKVVEIDLIVQTGNVIVFVEVKARNGKSQDPLEAITMKKMKQIAKGADIYLRMMAADYEYRYDVFTLTGDMESYTSEVHEDAFVSPLK